MTVHEALTLFEAGPETREKHRTLQDVGLGSIRPGQRATTLSGGEAQRIDLSKALSRKSAGYALYPLDEPTTVLHFDAVKKLLSMLDRLVEQGNTVGVIEHNLKVIKTADWILDVGPVGGDTGGRIVAEGSPKAIARVEGSYTGRFLRHVLAPNR